MVESPQEVHNCIANAPPCLDKYQLKVWVVQGADLREYLSQRMSFSEKQECHAVYQISKHFYDLHLALASQVDKYDQNKFYGSWMLFLEEMTDKTESLRKAPTAFNK